MLSTFFLSQIEEQQRVDTRERQRLGIEWKQKVVTDAYCTCVYIICISSLHYSCFTLKAKHGYTTILSARDSRS